jgi:AcrR family transcriptional regulator
MAHTPTDIRRQQFIDAAVVVIARDGVDGATTRRIAEEAGAPLATLYYCFQTKENLLWAVFEQLAEAVRQDIGNTASRGQATGSVASRLVRQAIEWAIACPDANRTQFEIWFWAKRNDPELAVRLYKLFMGTWLAFVRGARTPLPEAQLESVVHVVVGLVDGLCMQLISHGDEAVTRRKVDTATRMLEAYLD